MEQADVDIIYAQGNNPKMQNVLLRRVLCGSLLLF